MVNLSRWSQATIPSAKEAADELKKLNYLVTSHPYPYNYRSLETTHKGRAIYWLVRGQVTFHVSGQSYELNAGDKLDVSANESVWFSCHAQEGSHFMMAQENPQWSFT